MNEITPQAYILKINGECLEFVFDFASLLELEQRHGAEAVQIFNELLTQRNTMRNFCELLASSCKTRKITAQELEKKIFMNKAIFDLSAQIILGLMSGFIEDTSDAIEEATAWESEQDNTEPEQKKKAW